MGTIIPRKRKDGSTGYTAQILIKRGGKTVHREAKTFDRRQAAAAWLKRRETELSAPGGLERKEDPPLAVVIDRYIAESEKKIGRTKAQVLRTIRDGHEIAELRCSEIGSGQILTFARALKVSPQTRQNYLSHLQSVFAVARPAWGYPLDRQAIKDALAVTKKLGITGKGGSRKRRPTLEELDRLIAHFAGVLVRRPRSVPMTKIIPFAIFSARRQEEITRLAWPDLDETESRILVRDMKHPGDKKGNDTWCDLTPEALAYIQSMPRAGERIFPYSTDAISANFTRACKLLGVDNLHFHDLRHEGVSWLFEIGNDIPRVAKVSGHRSWSSLKRYSHIRKSGNKYAAWKWRTPHEPLQTQHP